MPVGRRTHGYGFCTSGGAKETSCYALLSMLHVLQVVVNPQRCPGDNFFAQSVWWRGIGRKGSCHMFWYIVGFHKWGDLIDIWFIKPIRFGYHHLWKQTYEYVCTTLKAHYSPIMSSQVVAQAELPSIPAELKDSMRIKYCIHVSCADASRCI